MDSGRRRRARSSAAAAARGTVSASLGAEQAGIVARRQLVALGITDGQIGGWVDAGHWVGVYPGVYATFTGPLPPLARAWAAVLYAGDGAVLGGAAALWLWAVVESPPEVMTVCLPPHRRVRHQPGIDIQLRRGLPQTSHPAAVPPRLRVEHALLDVTAAASQPQKVVDLVLRVTRGRHTTPERIAAALAQRHAHRWRGLTAELLEEVRDGVQSTLERRWVRDVERPHGLPAPDRNAPDTTPNGPADPGGHRRVYRDLRYSAWRLVIELDGRAAHPPWLQFRDRRRDNVVTVRGSRTLRYGWFEVVEDPCAVAAEVAHVLRQQGWTGTLTPCGPSCAAARALPTPDSGDASG